MADEMRELYSSPNGDRWYLARDVGRGQVFIRHEPNPPSGGQATRIEIGARPGAFTPPTFLLKPEAGRDVPVYSSDRRTRILCNGLRGYGPAPLQHGAKPRRNFRTCNPLNDRSHKGRAGR